MNSNQIHLMFAAFGAILLVTHLWQVVHGELKHKRVRISRSRNPTQFWIGAVLGTLFWVWWTSFFFRY